MSSILVVAEQGEGKLKKYSVELVGKALLLAKDLGGEVITLLIGQGGEGVAAELVKCGTAKVIIAAHPDLVQYSGEGYAKVLAEVIAQEQPVIVLGSATHFGKDLLARTAMQLGVGLATDCIALTIEGGRLKARRPIFAGKAQVDVVPEGTPQMASSRPNTYLPPEPQSGTAQVIPFTVQPTDIRARVTKVIQAEGGMVDLTEADRIVSGGRSLASADNFKIIRELAAAIGATVGASRAAVDAGYISHDHQVGQTGKTVNPTLYIACGISGAIQHLAGMRTAKVVVAINKDAEAPIFSKADYGIVGDLFQIVPALTTEFKKLLHE